MDIIHIDSKEDLRREWRYVSRGLHQIIHKTQPAWIPEDIYASVSSGLSSLFLCKDKNLSIGFFVLEEIKDPYERYLNIWALYGIGECDDDKKKQVIDFIDKISDSKNIKSRFSSPRDGWGRVLKDYYEASRVVYVRKARHGE